MNRPRDETQRLAELQSQSNQALMEGYEVPERLQEERQSLEKAIPALQKALRAAKVGDLLRSTLTLTLVRRGRQMVQPVALT